jgi:hypothetical protein
MNLTVTVISLALLMALAVLCGWRGARPADIQKGPRMMPWRLLMMICVVAIILFVVHLLNLFGMQTGGAPRY